MLIFISAPGCIDEKNEYKERFVGKLPPELTVEQWFNSKPLSLRKDLMGKVILLEFTYPTPKTVYYLMRLKSKFENHGFEIISFLNRSDERIHGFINGMRLNYIVVRDDDGVEGEGNDRRGKTWNDYGIPQSVDPDFKDEARGASYKGPTAFLIGRSGKVGWEGQARNLREDMIKKFLEEWPKPVLKKIAERFKKGVGAVGRKDYQTAIRYFQEVIAEADGTKYASRARKEIDGIKEIASAYMKEATIIEKKGKKSETMKAYRKIATDFKGIVIAKEAQGRVIKLEVEAQGKDEGKP